MTTAEVRAALDLYHIQHADECNCEACNAYDDATDEVEHPVDGVIVRPESLAAALHAWRARFHLAGCGWRFGSRIAAEASSTGREAALCPCPEDAAAVLAALAAEGGET